ncbi:MAG TPA: hypothetical protein VLD57_02845, partial [Blastocatellia bacterium]|nr:hypothetical protein [Blastocatellia bacterium]
MSRITLRLSAISILVLGISYIGLLPASTDSSKQTDRKAPVIDASYRSRTGFHKVILYNDDQARRDSILAAGGRVLAEYESFSLMAVPSAGFNRMSLDSASVAVRDDLNMLLLRAGAFDTTEGEQLAMSALAGAEPTDAQQLYLVQMIGPVKQE